MAVNPKLAALMRIIEDNQDKMPEGEYLEAMNALGALHREIPEPLAAVPVVAIVPIPAGAPPSYAESAPLFVSFAPVLPQGMCQTERYAWERVKMHHPNYRNLSANDWMAMDYETRFRVLREATDFHVDITEQKYNNPTICPFIARHAVGSWRNAGEQQCIFREDEWTCVCGYTGKTKNWKRHEQSERHQDWAKHRTVSRRIVEKMKRLVHDDECGEVVKYAAWPSPIGLYPGAIRRYTVCQEKNEWTHPELYAEFHRSPIPTEDGVGRWFVHPRVLRAKEYIQ
jgi:hypothetical protein